MVIRRVNRTVIKVTSNKGNDYLVTLDHLKNNAYGNPRYEACITSLAKEDHYKNYYCGAVYRFTGHYFGDEKECEWVVNYHEEHLK